MVQIPRLRELRELKGWTQKDLARESGVSHRSIAGYEAGAGVRPNTARKLAEALGVEVAELVMASGKAPAPPSPEQPSLNGLLEEERRLTLLRALRDDLRLAAHGVRRWLEMESFSKIEGYEAAPETVLSLWTGLSNAVQDDALTRHAVWNVLLEAPASSRAGNAEEQALVSGAREYLEEYIAATRSLRERLDSEWQQLAEQEPEQEPEQKADADNVVPLPVREAWEAHVRHQASA